MEITNRAALALLEDLETRRLANEELAAKAIEVIDRAVYANREEAWRTALRLAARALPRIIAEATEPAPFAQNSAAYDEWCKRHPLRWQR